MILFEGLKDINGTYIKIGSDKVKLTVFQGYEPTSICDTTHDVIDGKSSEKNEYVGIIKFDEFGNTKINDFYLINLHQADKYTFEILGGK